MEVKKYLIIFNRGFMAIVKHSQKISTLVEMMYIGHGKDLPCFEKGNTKI